MMGAQWTVAEAALSQSTQRYWAGFVSGAFGGDKSGMQSAAAAAGAVGADPAWPPYDVSARRTLFLDVPAVSVAGGYRDSFCDYWDSTGNCV